MSAVLRIRAALTASSSPKQAWRRENIKRKKHNKSYRHCRFFLWKCTVFRKNDVSACKTQFGSKAFLKTITENTKGGCSKMSCILLHPLLGWTKNSADWRNWAKARLVLLSVTRRRTLSKQRGACSVFPKRRKTPLASLLFLLSKSPKRLFEIKETQRSKSELFTKKWTQRSLWRRRGEVYSKHEAQK